MRLFLDFETRSIVDLKKCGAEVYARHPSTEVMCTGVAFDDEAPLVFSWGKLSEAEISHVKSGGAVVAHNAPFELAIWNYCGVKKYGWPPLHPEQIDCTMARAYAMALPGSLADAANALGLTQNKDSVGHRIMMQLSQPKKMIPGGCLQCEGDSDCPDCYGTGMGIDWYTPITHPDKFQALNAYCVQDILVERELDKRLLALSPSERKVWILDRTINDRGVQVDVESAKAAMALVEAEKERLDAEMRKITGGAVATCSAVAQITAWLTSLGVKAVGVTKADVTALLDREDLPAVAKAALQLRQEAAKSSTAKIEAMLRGVCGDGRLRGMFQYNGAGATGRWAGRRVQLQNLPRSKMKQTEIEAVFSLLKGIA
jgi:DNA polymerase